jgi:hypothetical protein
VSAALLVLILAAGAMTAAEAAEAASVVGFAGYPDCILLQNGETKVILDPNCGGRVLEYSYRGVNAIMLDAEQNGWTYQDGGARIDPCGGRLDIGPEMTIPKHPVLWLGRWEAEITGERSARLTSQPDSATGVQLTRAFRLSERSSRLEVTQTIRNVSSDAKAYCHWSRTLARPGGICVVPLTRPSRFPNGYIMYGPGPVMNYRPEDSRIRVQDDCLVIEGPPARPKLGIDSYAGWLAYVMPEDLLFVKRFPTYPERVYGEMAAITVSIYYHPRMCELEPIGPMAQIPPGGSASFTEVWWLLEMPFPAGDPDVVQLKRIVDSRAR